MCDNPHENNNTLFIVWICVLWYCTCQLMRRGAATHSPLTDISRVTLRSADTRAASLRTPTHYIYILITSATPSPHSLSTPICASVFMLEEGMLCWVHVVDWGFVIIRGIRNSYAFSVQFNYCKFEALFWFINFNQP